MAFDTKTFLYIFVPLCISYALYINLILKRNKAREALSGIDIQLKKRFDLIPNILKIAVKFMEHERDLITHVTELRSQAIQNYDSKGKEEILSHLNKVNVLGSKMGQLMVAVENYPDLKANQTFQNVMISYDEIEEQISASRRFYNSAVNELNNSIEIFPSNIIARVTKIYKMPFYEAPEISKQDLDSSAYLK